MMPCGGGGGAAQFRMSAPSCGVVSDENGLTEYVLPSVVMSPVPPLPSLVTSRLPGPAAFRSAAAHFQTSCTPAPASYIAPNIDPPELPKLQGFGGMTSRSSGSLKPTTGVTTPVFEIATTASRASLATK